MIKSMDNINEISMTVNKTTTVSETVTVTYKLNGLELSQELKDKIFFTLNLARIKDGNNNLVKKPVAKQVYDEDGKPKMKYRIKGDGSIDHSVKPKPVLKDTFPDDWPKLDKAFYDPKHNSIAYLTGPKHGLFVIDYDDPQLYNEDVQMFPELNNYIEQSRKGYHCYFKSNKYSSDIGSRNQPNDHAIDFLDEGKCVFSYPTKYKGAEMKLLQHNELKSIRYKLYSHLCKKYGVGKNGGKKISNNKRIEMVVEKKVEKVGSDNEEDMKNMEMTEEKLNEINKILNDYYQLGAQWIVSPIKSEKYKNSFSITPVSPSRNCLVCLENDEVYPHQHEGQSSLFVNRNKVKARCIGKHSEQSDNIYSRKVSRRIRELIGLIKPKEEKIELNGQLEGEICPYRVLMTYLNEDALKNRYRKFNGKVYQQNEIVPTYYKQIMTYEEYINKVFMSDKEHPVYMIFTSSHYNFDSILKGLNNTHYSEFALLQPSKYHFSYLNGVYDIEKNEFFTWGSHPDVSTHMLFEKDFDTNWLSMSFNELQTPYFDKLTKIHFDNEEYNILLCLLGRLFFEVRHSNWQVMPFLKGCGRTGKSTLVDFISSFFMKGKVKVLSNTFEGKFGLQNVYDGDIFICPELPSNIKKILDSSLFKSMVSGDSINVAKKNRDPEPVDWKVPMLWCGNHLPDFDDDGNAATRRLAVFYMNKRPDESIANLPQLLREEGYITLVKLITCYHHYRLNVIKNVIFEDWGKKLGINCFDKKLFDIKSANNKVYDFIMSDEVEHEHNGDCVVIRRDPNIRTKLTEFQKEYYKYLGFKYEASKKSNPWTDNDETTITDCGFTIEKKTYCIDCKSKVNNCLKLTNKPCNKSSYRAGKWIIGMDIVNTSSNGEI
jgi:hypothetical protein